MAAGKRSGRYSALMFLDLDNFKTLNDTQGHFVGDLLLIEAARRIGSCVREVDVVARFGGDEFVVILNELDVDHAQSVADARVVAEKLRAALDEPYLLTFRQEGRAEATVEHHCTISIGVVVFLDHEGSQDDILKWADSAMYQAKEAGRNVIRYFDLKARPARVMSPAGPATVSLADRAGATATQGATSGAPPGATPDQSSAPANP